MQGQGKQRRREARPQRWLRFLPRRSTACGEREPIDTWKQPRAV